MDSLQGQEVETVLANMVKSTKNTKISQAWWCLPVPATWEAEAGELLETTKWRQSETPSQNKQTNKQTNKTMAWGF